MTTTWQPKSYKHYQWIVKDPELLSGSLAIRGTRLPVWLILEGLSNGLKFEDFQEDFGGFPKEALPEIFKVAQELVQEKDGHAA